MNYIDLTEKLVRKCLGMGADAAEVYIEAGRNLSINVLNREIETIEEASSQGVGFRVFTEGRMGFSHCNDFSNKSLEDTISKAIAFARLSTPDENNVLPDDKTVTTVADLYDPAIKEEPMDKKIKMALDLEKIAMEAPGITKSSGAGYSEGESEVFIGNSGGVYKSYRSSGCSLGVSVVAEKDEQKNTGSEYCSRVYFSDLVPLEKIAASASLKAVELLDPVMIKTQRAAVIFDRDVVRSLFGGVISALNGERVLQGASFLKDFMNRRFASQLITIIDDPTLPRSTGSSPFDGEGVPTRKIILVENGTVKNFIYNARVARRAGTQSTGSALRGGFTSLPGIGTHKTFILPGKSSPQEIITGTARGLLLKEVTGYGVDPVSGNFSGGASGLWIENGQIVHPVRGVTIAGKASDIFSSIDMTGNDTDMNRSFAAPTMRIAEMQIGGK
jgi:PmbA protein